MQVQEELDAGIEITGDSGGTLILAGQEGRYIRIRRISGLVDADTELTISKEDDTEERKTKILAANEGYQWAIRYTGAIGQDVKIVQETGNGWINADYDMMG